MKKLLTILILVLSLGAYAQRYELYAGYADHKDSKYTFGYNAGFNFIFDMNQRDSTRVWANRIILGMEHSGFVSDKQYFKNGNPTSSACDDCTYDEIGFNEGNYVTRNWVRGVSLNFGVEVTDNFFLLTGVTSYLNVLNINNNEASKFRETLIDFGIKYYWKLDNNWIFSPTIKYNPNMLSYSIGVSWNHF
ncbi:hypothetical protein BPT24_043 [Tenacibaculum phage pT24]|uniref:Outer membrane protein beta-barrel domain-containing protein n=1 Tax=Tenacibaculum phage pT24 TaxID=1880590 RepID=A0A1B4XWH6_9CAUD|nr:hypothetical protein HYP10_gp043 [Tenacibaculum phage pT24]BAV39166.1 hypothetical protein BPT24_043 [Tenacibaculum phage pT24]